MTKQTMWKNYRAIAGAHTYILGFEYKKELYMVTRKQVGQFLSYEQASRGQGTSFENESCRPQAFGKQGHLPWVY